MCFLNGKCSHKWWISGSILLNGRLLGAFLLNGGIAGDFRPEWCGAFMGESSLNNELAREFSLNGRLVGEFSLNGGLGGEFLNAW